MDDLTLLQQTQEHLRSVQVWLTVHHSLILFLIISLLMLVLHLSELHEMVILHEDEKHSTKSNLMVQITQSQVQTRSQHLQEPEQQQRLTQ